MWKNMKNFQHCYFINYYMTKCGQNHPKALGTSQEGQK